MTFFPFNNSCMTDSQSLMIPDPCSTYWGPGGEKKNDYETHHALWNQYNMLYPTIFFFLKTRKPSINFILQKKKSAVGLSE